MDDERLFGVRTKALPDGVAVVARGEIDLSSSGDLRQALTEAEGDPVILDLREVTFLDSSGLGVIVGQNKRAAAEGFRFAVAVAGAPAVRRILELSGLAKVLEVVEDPAESVG